MITIYKTEKTKLTDNGELMLVEMRGLSTDEKPILSIENGSAFIEIDTGKVYLFDLENKQWKEI